VVHYASTLVSKNDARLFAQADARKAACGSHASGPMKSSKSTRQGNAGWSRVGAPAFRSVTQSW
jgi:hypothetical protein